MNSDQHITIKLDKAISNKDILIVAVYAKCNSEDRKLLWLSLQDDSNLVDVPWCIRGDFNVILDPNERAKPHRMSKSIDFQNCMDSCGVTVLASRGLNFLGATIGG